MASRTRSERTPWSTIASPARRIGLGLALLLVVTLGVTHLRSAFGLALLRAVDTPSPSLPAPAVPATLYVSDRADGSRLLPLDSETLRDLEGRSVIGLDAPAWSSAVSAAGSTSASVEPLGNAAWNIPPPKQEIVVRDAATGRERTRFSPPAPVDAPYLGRDGSRLVALRSQVGLPASGESQPTEWDVFDTASGRLVTVVRAESAGQLPALVDGEARRLYQFVAGGAGAAASSGPRPLRVIAYDLTTGAPIGRLDLADVAAGDWPTGRTHEGLPVTRELIPGVALSPDGRRLAVVHADARKLTLIATGPLVVERTVELSRPAGLGDLLPVAARVAYAKPLESTRRQAVFGPDGRRLYGYGIEVGLDQNGQAALRGLGLELVDAERGAVVAEALSDAQFTEALPAPDGRSLYVLGPKPTERGGVTNAGPSAPFLLRRLDAASLAVRAERQLTGPRRLFLVPMPQ